MATTNNYANNAQNSAVNFGPNSENTVTNNYNNEMVDLNKELLELLKNEKIATESKGDLEEIISTVTEEANSEQPKKAIIKNLMSSAKSIMDTVTASPQIIEVYTKWSEAIGGILSKLG